MDTTNNQQSTQIQWDSLIEAVLSEKHVEAFAAIPENNLTFILEPLNRNFIVQSVLTSLIKSDHPKANTTYANEIVDLLVQLAEQFKKSQA